MPEAQQVFSLIKKSVFALWMRNLLEVQWFILYKESLQGGSYSVIVVVVRRNLSLAVCSCSTCMHETEWLLALRRVIFVPKISNIIKIRSDKFELQNLWEGRGRRKIVKSFMNTN